VGVSQLIGVGGRDLRAEVGGLMAMRAISILADDPATDCLVVVAKSPDPEIASEIAARAGDAGKPSVLAFPGAQPMKTPDGVEQVDSLEAAAARAAALMGGATLEPAEQLTPPSRPGAVRGLFCGGTLRDEALAVFSAAAGESRAPLALEHADDDYGDRDAFIDFGSERLTRGRAHPMIDPTLRDREIERQAGDERVGALLVDVVLGRCAHPDPAAHLAPAIERALADRSGDELAVVVSLCGAQRDSQGLAGQAQRLRDAGATVTRSNAHAARLAVRAAGIADPVPAGVRR
jgi:FdrA protein